MVTINQWKEFGLDCFYAIVFLVPSFIYGGLWGLGIVRELNIWVELATILIPWYFLLRWRPIAGIIMSVFSINIFAFALSILYNWQYKKWEKIDKKSKKRRLSK